MGKEYIICAAIKLVSPRELKTTYTQLSLCEIGFRHCDIFECFGDKVSRHPSDQGFFTSKGRFVDRREAMKIAYYAGQVSFEKAIKDLNGAELRPFYKNFDEDGDLILEGEPIWNQLYSEDLY